MKIDKIRKEIQLSQEVLDSIQVLADKKKWSLKKMMEEIIVAQAKRVQKTQLTNQ